MNTSKFQFRFRQERVQTALTFALPVVFLFAVYWAGLRNWFEQDDFAWLGLHTHVDSFSTFLSAMFTPMAQGTIRPWSERGFFLLFYALFQSNAVPYHVAVFITETANLVLLGLILRKLTNSRLIAAAAPILWTANFAMLTPLCWVSDYNQIQCVFFLLLAFLLYLHDRYWLQFVVFLLGFGALELNIVYPAIVLAYVVTCQLSRRRVLRTLPLFAASGAYYLLHTWAAPRQSTGIYALHLDHAIPVTLWTYWRWALATADSHLRTFPLLLFTALLIGFVAYQAKRNNRLPLFFLLWFLITLSPTLPLRDHISDYYLAIPVLGLGAILALAIGTASKAVRFAAVPLVGLYLFVHVPHARAGTHWYLGHTRAVRSLVWGVRHARQLHPGKTILLTDISDDLYADAIAHSVFRTLDIPDVYLAPELTEQVDRLDKANPDRYGYILPAGPTIHALQKEKLIIYSAKGEHLRNVTSSYERAAGQRYGWDETKNLPRRLDAGSPLMGYLLGSTWYSPEGSFRWMPSRASFRIGGPRTFGDKLTLAGYCPPEQTESGPLAFSVSVDGKVISESSISKPETSFSRTFVLPRDLVGRESVEFTIAVNRTLDRTQGSPLGLAFGVFEIR